MIRKLAALVLVLFIFNLGCGRLLSSEKKVPETQRETTQEQAATPPETKPQDTGVEAKVAAKPQAQPKAKPKASAPSTPQAVVTAPIPPAPAASVTSAEIAEVEKMVLNLVNQDRRKYGLSEVVWDETAARAARQQVQDEANIGFISHWGLSGIKPQLRYTRAGGCDAVDENESVTLWLQGGFNGISKAELYKVVAEHQALMVNEQPPNDGHRKNILDKHHTGLGVAISVGKYGVAMAQEFTNHYANLTLVATSSNQVNLSGKILSGYEASGIYAVWEEPPKPMTRDQLMQTKSYSDPPFDNLHFWASPKGTSYYISTSKGNIFAHNLTVDAQGNFSLAIPLSSTPGLDYITLEIAPKSNAEDRFYAGQFVMEIK
ncbi:MAG TPA: CAP domain-containing protein [Verrucomicrobiae bacterium]|nr:CAP domain-containing protein [Verrucomicrobiae bacterium]